ncbi:zinc-binding metallopeptidase family protein [Dinoroseobacter sp. S124A]|uniref:zinc-binding metallopeptidase family protein n=1 Tax=Dinoroseobacter sp. S124A TaxID=3415128 RepID=UPI003C7C0BA8
MRVFQCPSCGEQVYFENLQCGCGVELGFDADLGTITRLARPCAFRDEIVCNWQASEAGAACAACATTRTHPDLAVEGNAALWRRAEAAKRWVFAQLMGLGWFAADDPGARPSFDLLSEQTRRGPVQPMMGHLDGHITINVAEADPAEIIARREQMDEPYRTMIGHFRHEIAHFLFLRLAEDPGFADQFRGVFGDERTDYGAALAQYHDAGADPGWRAAHITAYASSHPHEDWAETAAHALHLRDVTESARAVGLAPAEVPDDAGEALSASLELTMALNHVNRAMGLGDLYPFVVTPAVRAKLRVADALLTEGPAVPG